MGEDFSGRQGALTREYFVYFKEKQRSMEGKDPLRRRFTLVNTGSKIRLQESGVFYNRVHAGSGSRMIYTEKSRLAVLELFEERDFVTFEELIPILRECPSKVVYIDVRGVLYGIVTEKRITSAALDGQNHVKIKTDFKSVQCGEYMATKRFFEKIDKTSFTVYFLLLFYTIFKLFLPPFVAD